MNKIIRLIKLGDLMQFFDRIPLDGSDEYAIFSETYFIALIVSLGVLYFVYRYLPILKNRSWEKYIRIIIAVFIIYTSFNIYSFFFKNNLPWYRYIPEGTCGFSAILVAIMLLTKNKFIYKLLLFWSWGAFLALFAPNIKEGPNYYYFYQFYLRHILIVVSVFYMMRVFNYKIIKSDYRLYVYITLPLALIGLMINYLVYDPYNLNILFMMKPAISNTPLDLIYQIHPLLYSFVWIWIAVILGYLYALPFYSSEKVMYKLAFIRRKGIAE
ncbi:MAG: hypothetical protein ACOCUD_03200 [Bacillota bacterium]